MMKFTKEKNDILGRTFHSLNDLFQSKGHEIRMVGGAVRDFIKDEFPVDIDFCTTMSPEEMMALDDTMWEKIPTGLDHGTVTFMSLFGCFEITTLRKDIETDGRRATVEFTDNWKIDAERRDFTMNALSMDIHGNVFDWFNGQEHLRENRVVFVGDAKKRIEEDALRIMRFFRFTTKMNSEIDFSTFKVISDNVHLLKNVSVERIWEEIKKTVKIRDADVGDFFKMLELSGISDFVCIPGKKFNWEKLKNLQNVMTQPWEQVPATFFIGGLCDTVAEAEAFADNFKLSNEERKELVFFAEFKDFNPDNNQIGFGPDDAINMVHDGVDKLWIKSIASWQRNGWTEECVDGIVKREFPVTGQDLINLGFKQGPEIGKNLAHLKQKWKSSRFTMTKEMLLGGPA